MEDTDMTSIRRAFNGVDRVIVGGDTILRLGLDRIKGCMISGNEMYTIDFKNDEICTFDERFGSDHSDGPVMMTQPSHETITEEVDIQSIIKRMAEGNKCLPGKPLPPHEAVIVMIMALLGDLPDARKQDILVCLLKYIDAWTDLVVDHRSGGRLS